MLLEVVLGFDNSEDVGCDVDAAAAFSFFTTTPSAAALLSASNPSISAVVALGCTRFPDVCPRSWPLKAEERDEVLLDGLL